MIRYRIAEFTSAQEFLSHVARRRGKLLKGGIPDYQDAARIVLQDWNNGGISYYTVPPAEAKGYNPYVTAAVVSTFGKEFDIDALLAEADNSSVMVLPSIDSVPANDLVEIINEDEETLDSMFLNSLSLGDDEGEYEAMDDGDEEDEDDDEEDDEDFDEMDAEVSDEAEFEDAGDSVPHVKNPIRADDDLNLQVNRLRAKDLKKQKKKEKKKGFVSEAFDFNADFVADNDGEGNEDDDDEDLLDI